MPVSIPPILVPITTSVSGRSTRTTLGPSPEAFARAKMLARKLFFQKESWWKIWETPLALSTPLQEMAGSVARAYANGNIDEDIFITVCNNFEKLTIPPCKGLIEETITKSATVIIHEYNQCLRSMAKETTWSVH